MAGGFGRRELLVSKVWVQAVALVVLFGFFVLGLLAYRAYTGQPPIPERVVDPGGRVVFTGEDVTAGQGVFLKNGLMQYGSIFGHGAYLGPDYTADYLRRSALFVRDSYGGEGSDRAAARTVEDFKENRYDPGTRTLGFTGAQAAAFEELRGYYGRYFGEPTTRYGLRPEAISDPEEIRQLTAYFAWTAWASSALRPGLDYTYTNNWPPESLVENEPTANVVVWSVLSLIALLGGIGLLFAAFGRWNFLGWHGREGATLSFRTPGDVALTPAQRACAWFFLVMAALFLIQTLAGAASEHYRADLAGFFGIDLAQVLPYNLIRTWHVQLAIFWVATSFLAAGIFLAPMISGREPRGQHVLAFALLGALALVVFGSMIGEWLGIFGFMGEWSAWFGNQASSTWTSGASGRSSSLSACSSGSPYCSGGCAGGCGASTPPTCPGCSFSPRSRYLPSTRSACSPGPSRTSPPPTSGASGSCICGSRTSWSCSRPSWSPTSSCCSASCARRWRSRSSSWTSCSTPRAA